MRLSLLLFAFPIWASDVAYFRITRYFGAFDAIFQQLDEQTELFSESQVYDEFSYKGGLLVSLDGYVLHTNFLRFDATGSHILAKGDSENALEASDYDIDRNTHDVRLHFFEKKALRFELYSRSSFSTSERRFLGRFFGQYKTSGAKLISTTRHFPFTLNWSKGKTETRTLEGDQKREKRDALELKMSLYEGPNSNAAFLYFTEDYSERLYDIDYDKSHLNIYYRFRHGSRSGDSFSANFSRTKVTGRIFFENLVFWGTNQTHFQEDLWLLSHYAYAENKTFETVLKQHSLSNTLFHRLYQSLVSSLKMDAQKEDSDDQKITRVGPEFVLDYQKKIPKGSLSIQQRVGLENADYQSRHGLIAETQSIDFRGFDQLTMPFLGIDVSSIRLTNNDMTEIYFEGFDFEVLESNGLVTLVRLPEGNIDPFQSLLVFFTYSSYPDFSAERHSTGTNVHLRLFGFLSAFYGQSDRTNEVDSDFVVPSLDDFETSRYGCKLETKYVRCGYHLERLKSNISNHKAKIWSVNIAKRILANTRVSLFHSSRKTEIFEQDFTNDFRSTQIRILSRLFDRMKMEASFRRYKYQTISQLSDRETLLVLLNWRIRQVEIAAFYEKILDQTDYHERARDKYYFKFRRFF